MSQQRTKWIVRVPGCMGVEGAEIVCFGPIDKMLKVVATCLETFENLSPELGSVTIRWESEEEKGE